MYRATALIVLAVAMALLMVAAASADRWGADRAGESATTTMFDATSEPAWNRALRLRSEALNRQYGLGAWEFRTSPAALGDEPAWLRALRLRSEALNQQYKLGEHAPRS